MPHVLEEFIALKTHPNQFFVCAEGGGGRDLVANRVAMDKWEIFRVVKLVEEEFRTMIALKAFNGQFVCAEGGGGGEVNANRDAIGPWETFRVFFGDSSAFGKELSLQTSNSHWLCAEGGGGFEVVANRVDAATWETFTVITPPPEIIALQLAEGHW